MATEMACTSDIMDHEASYFAALADARTLERTGDRLTLLDGAGEAVLQFERAASAAAIAEVDWVMASGSWNDRGPSLRVTGDRATGFTGCNRWFAAAALGPGALTFSEVGQTKMACTGPGGAMEREFLDVLARTRAYRVESGFLIVQDDAGRALMRFARAN